MGRVRIDYDQVKQLAQNRARIAAETAHIRAAGIEVHGCVPEGSGAEPVITPQEWRTIIRRDTIRG